MMPLIAEVGPDGVSGDATVVPWWSFGKTILAAAALTLVRDGAADLDEVVVGDATLAELLQHRAGLADYGAVPAYRAAVTAGAAAWTRARLLAEVDRTVDRSVWRYSNVGYLHVRAFLEERCRADLGALLRARVFLPLGIAGARLAVAPADTEGVAGLAAGYDPNWVYHGLVVGPLREAARLLHKLATGDLLPADLMARMRAPLPLGGPDSVLAVYHHPGRGRTRAAFLPGGGRDQDNEAAVERAALPDPEFAA